MLDNVVPMPSPPQDHNPFAKFNTPNSPILFPVGERRVGWEMRDGNYQRTNSHKAIIRLSPRGDGAQLLNIVGANYKIVHNRELFTAVEDAMQAEMLPEHLHDVQVTDKVSGWGKVCYRQYVFPSIKCKIPYTRSEIGFRLIVQNGYGGSALRMHAGAIDFWCSNGMIRGEFTSTYRKHTSRLEVGNLNEIVVQALMTFATSQDVWTNWFKTSVTSTKVIELFDAVATSAKMKDALLDQYSREQETRGSNLWAVYSVLTYYASHAEGPFSLRRTVDEQDTVASTMLQRELNVAKWVQTKEWKQLEQV